MKSVVLKQVMKKEMIAAVFLLTAAVFLCGYDFMKFVIGGGQEADAFQIIVYALKKEGAVWTLPVASALLASQGVWEELDTGYVLFSVSRLGRNRYMTAYTAAPVLSGAVCAAVSAILSLTVVTVLLHVVPGEKTAAAGTADQAALFCILLVRCILSAVIWTLVSGAAALLIRNAYAALVCPFVLCYVLSVFRKRYYPGAMWADPVGWIGGAGAEFAVLLSAAVLVCLLYVVLLKRRVRYV